MDHFQRHRSEFGFSAAAEYEAAAASLFTLPLSPTVWECNRPNGDVLRYDTVNDQFGILAGDDFMRTMFRPRRSGGESRRDYFERQCSKVKP